MGTKDVKVTATVVGSIPTLVRVFLCPCVGPFPSVGLTLTWFIWDRNLALHITLYSVNSVGDQGSSSGLFDLFGSSMNGVGLFHSFSDGFKFHISPPFMIDKLIIFPRILSSLLCLDESKVKQNNLKFILSFLLFCYRLSRHHATLSDSNLKLFKRKAKIGNTEQKAALNKLKINTQL